MPKFLSLCAFALLLSGCIRNEIEFESPMTLLATSVDLAFERQAESAAECNAQAETGELVGQYALIDCKTTALQRHMNHARYPYEDLVTEYVTTVRGLALEIDCAERPEQEVKTDMQTAYEEWLYAEEYRCHLDNIPKQRRQPGNFDPRPIFDQLKGDRSFECFRTVPAVRPTT